jgi:protein-disulfide isomerase
LALYAPGKINVVEFVDYECPVCRAYNPELHALLEQYGDRVHFVRLNFPLRMHEFARDAARAQVCVREQGKGEAMAALLLESEDLRPDADRRLAATLNIDLNAYDACITTGFADRKIEQDSAPIGDALQGLPTTFVGAKTLIGLQTQPVLRDAFDRAAQGETEHGVPGPWYLLGSVALAGVVIWVGRAQRATL